MREKNDNNKRIYSFIEFKTKQNEEKNQNPFRKETRAFINDVVIAYRFCVCKTKVTKNICIKNKCLSPFA